MRVTANMSADSSIYNIQQGRKRLDKLQETISSNQNINRPSDDPISSRLLLDIGDKIKASDQYNTNMVNATTWMKIADTALSGMNDTMLQARTIMNSIISGSSDPTQRQLVHNQLIEFKKQIVDMANTQYGDQYVFGGANNLVPPFNETDNTYAGDGTERQIEIAQGATQTISVSGDRLLQGVGTDPSYGSTDVLQTFDDLIAAVGDTTTPSDAAAIDTAVQSLYLASRQIINAVNTNISRMVRVDNMSKLNVNNKNTLIGIAGNIQNPDLVKLGVQLSSENNAFQASLASTAKLSQLSLLDYLK
ncbi:MAG: flagellar hook-associated protein FlgL [Desulfuromonadales bacterium]